MYFVYVLQSRDNGTYYIGQTENVEKRIDEHNRGKSAYTKRKAPWNLIYVEEFDSRSKAMKREYEIKRHKSRKYIENLLNNRLNENTLGSGD
jgi:putative endonuclease